MIGYGDMKLGLSTLTKETQTLWEENKDMQGRFVNDLAELQRFQLAINQLENDQRHDQLTQTRQSMCDMQRRASQLYEQLTDRRVNLVKRLNDGVHQIAMLQNHLISERLLDWKNRQKLSQIGVLFDNRELLLDDIQMEFEMLAENNWQLRTFACWQLDLLRRSPQLSDNTAQTHITNLSAVLENLTKLLCMLVSQSFVVVVQPDPVLKTQHKFVAEVRLLIGDKLGIKQHLVNTNVTVKIIAEEEAKILSTGQINEKDIKTVGSISNEFEKLTLDEKGHMAAKFNNSKLTRIAHRKPPPKGMQTECKTPLMIQTATDQKYALLFHITPFQLGNLGKFDVWTLSLPLMVTVHGSQDCDAQGVILWQRAFSSVVICLALSVKTKRPKIKMILDAQIEKQWTSIFPAEVVNESDCILFLSRMTYIAFAEYLFNRNIVPSGAFVRRRIGGKTGTVFHTFNKSRWGIKLSDMLKGVAEAIKHKYARQAIIMINEDDRDVDLASEVFSVSFAYNGEDCFKITDQHGDTIVSLGYKDKATFRKQVAYIIKKIGKVNEQLVSFGKKITPFIKLTYFDERTPPDYHPMHFKGCKRAFYFDHAPPKFDFGIVSTSYSAMLFEIQSKYITSTSELEEVMMKNAVDEGNQLMDATFDGEMTMADIDQRSTPGDHRSSSFHTGLASAVHAKQDIRNSIEQMRAIEPDLLSPKSPELHHLKDANHSISERSGDNDTTNDDYPSPAQEINGGIKTRKNALKKQIKKKSPVKKRSIAPRKAKKNAMPSQGDLVETTPVSGSSSTTTRGKVSQTRISPPKELDSTPLRNKVLSSTSFKTSVAMRSFLQSPDDISDYGAH